MGRLYEAILRAEQRVKLGRGAEQNSGADGELGAQVESLSSVSTEISNSNTETPSIRSTAQEIQRPVEFPRRVATPGAARKPSTGIKENGFRRLTARLEEESRVFFHTQPRGLAAEQLRLMRQTLNHDFSAGAVLMISSPGMGDGKTLTSFNLCACLAEAGDPTLLVETDMRRPTAHKIVGCTVQSPGIEDALAGNVSPTEVVSFIEELSFHAAIVAKTPTDKSLRLNGASMKGFLTWARDHFRWIVLDSAPIVPVADVADLLPFADAALLVIRAQSTSRELSTRAIEMFGKHLYGVVLNDATIDSSPYYNYLRDYY